MIACFSFGWYVVTLELFTLLGGKYKNSPSSPPYMFFPTSLCSVKFLSNVQDECVEEWKPHDRVVYQMI